LEWARHGARQRQRAAKAAKMTGGKDNETWTGEIKRETDSLTSG